MAVRVLILGHPDRGDDGAAMAIAGALPGDVRRIGSGDLFDHLDSAVPTVIVDAVRGIPPGAVATWTLAEVAQRGIGGGSTHGGGPAGALRLWAALDRPLPPGYLVGIGGASFALGPPSHAVLRGLEALAAAVRAAAATLADGPPAA